jgi:hypothetical protein
LGESDVAVWSSAEKKVRVATVVGCGTLAAAISKVDMGCGAASPTSAILVGLLQATNVAAPIG